MNEDKIFNVLADISYLKSSNELAAKQIEAILKHLDMKLDTSPRLVENVRTKID